MRGGFAKVLFVLALLANLWIGLPMKAWAHSMAASPAVASHHGSSQDHHQQDMVASDPACPAGHHQAPAPSRAPANDTPADDCCHIGLGSPVLTDATGIVLTHWDGLDHGVPVSDQILASGTVAPLLRPPRA